jgi:hypothetical protein
MYEAIRELGYSPGLQAPEASNGPAADESDTSPIDAALSAAAQSDKLVFVDFSAEWCVVDFPGFARHQKALNGPTPKRRHFLTFPP